MKKLLIVGLCLIRFITSAITFPTDPSGSGVSSNYYSYTTNITYSVGATNIVDYSAISLDTVYTNLTGSNLFVSASFSLSARTPSSAGVSLSVDYNGDGSYLSFNEVVAPTNLLTADIRWLGGWVNNGLKYRFTSLTNNGSTVAIIAGSSARNYTGIGAVTGSGSGGSATNVSGGSFSNMTITASSFAGDGAGVTNINGVFALMPRLMGTLGTNDSALIQSALNFVGYSNSPIKTVILDTVFTCTNTIYLPHNAIYPWLNGNNYTVMGSGVLNFATMSNGVAVTGMLDPSTTTAMSYNTFKDFSIIGPGILNGAGTDSTGIGLYVGVTPTNSANIGAFACRFENIKVLGFQHGICATNIVNCVFQNCFVEDNWGSSYRLARIDTGLIDGGHIGGSTIGSSLYTNSIGIETFKDVTGNGGLGLMTKRNEVVIGKAFIFNHAGMNIDSSGGTYELANGTNFITMNGGTLHFDIGGGIMNFTPPTIYNYFYSEVADGLRFMEVHAKLSASGSVYVFGQSGIGAAAGDAKFYPFGEVQSVNNKIVAGVPGYVIPVGSSTVIDGKWVNVKEQDTDSIILNASPFIVHESATGIKMAVRQGPNPGTGGTAKGLTLDFLLDGLAGRGEGSIAASTFTFSHGPLFTTYGISDAGGTTNTGLGFFGNGSGLTDIGPSSLTGFSTNTFTIVNTNFVLNQLYTNNYGYPLIALGIQGVLTEAAVAGRSSITLGISGVGTNAVASQLTAIGLVTTGASTNGLSAVSIPVGATYKWTDSSSGIGNSATIQGGQLIYLQQQTIAPVRTYKVYRALLSQSGTNAPVATVLDNSLGGIPIWTYSDVGTYTITLSGSFPVNKTFVIAQSTPDGTVVDIKFNLNINQPNGFDVFVSNGDDLLAQSPIEILVYP